MSMRASQQRYMALFGTTYFHHALNQSWLSPMAGFQKNLDDKNLAVWYMPILGDKNSGKRHVGPTPLFGHGEAARLPMPPWRMQCASPRHRRCRRCPSPGSQPHMSIYQPRWGNGREEAVGATMRWRRTIVTPDFKGKLGCINLMCVQRSVVHVSSQITKYHHSVYYIANNNPLQSYQVYHESGRTR